MADVRALLAAERESRRLNHPHLTYTKSGALICNVCQLNVKSETLWEGHLRSANHKKNAQKAQEASTKNLKRKLDEVEVGGPEERPPPFDTDRRKIPKSRAVSLAEKETLAEDVPSVPSIPAQADAKQTVPVPPTAWSDATQTEPLPIADAKASPPQQAVDEDEWAAFERDIAAVDQAEAAPDYAAATISAAPLSAEQLAEQQAEDKRKQQELLAEDEQDDERGRIEEEFEIMEEMEERVRKLREKREALRAGVGGAVPAVGEAEGEGVDAAVDGTEEGPVGGADSESDSGSEDEDDWYS